jgi:hypothetical protein
MPACPACAADNMPDAAVCQYCGASLVSQPTAAPVADSFDERVTEITRLLRQIEKIEGPSQVEGVKEAFWWSFVILTFGLGYFGLDRPSGYKIPDKETSKLKNLE